MSKNLIPNSKSLDKHERKRIAAEKFHNLTPAEETEVFRKLRGKVSFSSLTLRRVHLDTVATTFIVHTYKPMKWIDFIVLVSDAFEEVL